MSKPGRCDSPQARAFDFWIGDWRIKQKIMRRDGSWLELDAKTSVSLALDGCALIEHREGNVQFFWEGMQSVEPMTGLSVRSYDPVAGKWHIYWMDSRSPRFGAPYAGNFVNDTGEFFRAWDTPQGKSLGRITFSDITPDSVHWELAISSGEVQSWSTIWIMDMYQR